MIQKAYAFTNENVSSYERIFDFKEKDVLSVTGSGDQYFTAILNDVASIELYDINPSTWLITILKFYGFLILSYEEFQELFIISRGTNMKLLVKVLPYMPRKEANEIVKYIKQKGNLSSMLLYSPLSDFKVNYQTGRIISYFDPEKYYELQNKLRNQPLPKIHFKSLLDMPQEVGKKNYDLILTSNIYQWLKLSPIEYKVFLNQFNAKEIQAHYAWNPSAPNRQEFESLDFEIIPVESVSPIKENRVDEVYVLRRTK